MRAVVYKTDKLKSKEAKRARKAINTFNTTKFTPTVDELEYFRLLQEHLCTKESLSHHRREKLLFLKLDLCCDGYGIIASQLKSDWMEKDSG